MPSRNARRRRSAPRRRSRARPVGWTQGIIVGAIALGILLARWGSALSRFLHGHAVTLASLAGGLALALGAALFWRYRRRQQHARALLTVQQLQGLSGIAFEEFLQRVFRQLGYQARLTKASGDFGADLLLTKHGKRTVVQAKRYQDSVGIAAVQEVLGAKAYYHADAMLVVTNVGYTKAAQTLAQTSGVVLWGREELARALQRIHADSDPEDRATLPPIPLP